MSWAELPVFLIFPMSGLAIGYVALRMSQRETRRFDESRGRAQ